MALLLVLWVLAVLIPLVLSFSFAARTEALSTFAFRHEAGGRWLAEAGIQRGLLEIQYRLTNKNQEVTLAGSDVLKADGTAYTVDADGGSFTFRIVDESGKINLNALTDQTAVVLRNLLVNEGVSPEEADVIVDSILDWKDGEDLHRLHGAENEYYLSLPRPYKAKNANFETLGELLHVRGVTRALLYGEGERKGIAGFLSVHSMTGQVNVNTAPREVLMAIPGMTEEAASRILEDRGRAELKAADVQAIAGAAHAAMAPYITADESNVKTLEAVGRAEGARAGWAIRAVVLAEAGGAARCIAFESPAEVNP
jgi:general secretion pathway protein K